MFIIADSLEKLANCNSQLIISISRTNTLSAKPCETKYSKIK